MEFRLLGAFEVWDGGQPVEIGGQKQRALLALLVLRANEYVRSELLANELWGERPPRNSAAALQSHVSRLRKTLGAQTIESREWGYVLRASQAETDLGRFEGLVFDAHPLAAYERASKLAEALAIWRGPALGDLVNEPALRPDIARLEELRLTTLERRIDADLEAGRNADLVGELEKLVAEQPLREHLRSQLMLALYRSGRQTDALEVYRNLRTILVETSGLEPGPELRRLEQAILRQDKELDLPRADPVQRPTAEAMPLESREDELAEAAAGPVAARGRRRLILATFGAAVIGVVAGVLLTQGGSSIAIASIGPDSVGVINPSNGQIATTFSAGAFPGGVAVGEGATWVTNSDANTVTEFKASSNEVTQTIQVGKGPVGVAVGGGAVWVANGLDGTVARIDPSVNPPLVKTLHVGNGPLGIAYGAHKIWVANSVDGTVSEIDPKSWKVRTFPAVPGATALVVAFGRVWVVSPSQGVVVSLNQRSGAIADPRIAVGVDPVAVAAGDGAIWVANRDDGTVSKIAPRSPGQAEVTEIVHQVGPGPISLATVKGSVWAAGEGTLSRIDATSGQVTRVIKLANPPQALTGVDRGLYVAVGSSPLEHRGGTLRVAATAPDHIDPALAYTPFSWRILAMTNDGLVGFRRVGGIEGVQLVPDLAVSLPTPSDSGRTYAFRLRPGMRYSTGKPVQPADFRTAIERVLESPLGAAQTGRYFRDIRGADRCRPGRRCNLASGIVTARRTVTFHLTQPDGDFLSKLALISAAAVPTGTPPQNPTHDHALPATGPYMIASYRQNRSLRLVRNPYFRQWSADAQPRGYPATIVFSLVKIGADLQPSIRAVEAGKADVALDLHYAPNAKGQLAGLAARYPSQLRTNASLETFFFFLNTREPPFDDVSVRRAVNDAFNRRAYTDILGVGSAPACQLLPPDFPAYSSTCPYGHGGLAALPAARQLVRNAGQSGARVTIWMTPEGGVPGRFMARLLDSIGLRARVQIVPGGFAYFNRILKPSTHAQIGFDAWAADYPSDAGFLPPILSCAGNASQFCNPAIDHLFARAESLPAQDPAATALWQKANRAILAQAPVVPADNQEEVAFVAKRVGNFQHHPEWGVLLDQLWVK